MRYRYLIIVPAVTLLAACAANPPSGFQSNPAQTSQRKAAAIERNRVEAAKAAIGEAQDPWRHMRPYDRH